MDTGTNEHINPAKRTRSMALSVPVAVLLAFLVVGCYTILKHPITSEEGRVQAEHQEYYRDRCLECHADYAEYPYGFFYGTYPDYYFEYPRWGYYYAYPWWWDNYWYQDGYADEPPVDENGEPITPSSKASRRGGLIPPYVGGATATPPPGGGGYRSSGTPSTPVKGGTGSGSTGAGTGSGTKIRVKKSSDSSGDDQATEETSDKKKKSGRRGGIEP